MGFRVMRFVKFNRSVTVVVARVSLAVSLSHQRALIRRVRRSLPGSGGDPKAGAFLLCYRSEVVPM